MTPRSALVFSLLFLLALPSSVPAQEPPPASLRWFDGFDRDGDGVLIVAEIDAAAPLEFLRLDRDGDGALTLEEYLADAGSDEDELRRARNRFAVIDGRGDGNGTVSLDEFTAFGKFVIEIADANGDGDGRMSRQEFIDSIGPAE
jgi:Ca2+-binding EF-hand superfamily protein